MLFDLINENMLSAIAPNADFQWYPTRRLADDIDRVVASGWDVINLTSAPISTGEIHAKFFSAIQIGDAAAAAPHYDVRSIYARAFGGNFGYLLNKQQVLTELASFLSQIGPDDDNAVRF